MNNAGTLFVVGTPIGNLGDITRRAVQTLRDVDVVCCEDTRVTAKLLAAYEIKKPLLSLHEHSDDATIAKLLQCLRREVCGVRE